MQRSKGTCLGSPGRLEGCRGRTRAQNIPKQPQKLQHPASLHPSEPPLPNPCPSQKFLECNELETGTVLFLNFAYNILERIFESEKPISTGLRGAVIYTTAPTRE